MPHLYGKLRSSAFNRGAALYCGPNGWPLESQSLRYKSIRVPDGKVSKTSGRVPDGKVSKTSGSWYPYGQHMKYHDPEVVFGLHLSS